MRPLHKLKRNRKETKASMRGGKGSERADQAPPETAQ